MGCKCSEPVGFSCAGGTVDSEDKSAVRGEQQKVKWN